MIYDKFGTIERGVFTYYPGIVRSADFYGFDRDDPVYKKRTPYEKGREDCPVCRIHDVRDRRYPCDVMLARARDMETAGYPATFCRSCSYAMPVRAEQEYSWQAKCWHCERVEMQHRRRNARNGGVYIDDGLGCVERIPSWMADFDGNVSAGGGQAFG